MKNLSIIAKFMFVMAVFGLFTIGMAYYSGKQLSESNDEYSSMLHHEAEAALQTAQANRAFQTARGALGDLLMSRTDAQNEISLAEYREARKTFEMMMQQAAAVVPADAEIPALSADAITVLDDSCAETVNQASIATAEVDVLRSQATFLKDCKQNFKPISARFVSKVADLHDIVEKHTVELKADGIAAVRTNYVVILAGLVVVGAAGFMMFRSSVVVPLFVLEKQMRRLAGGNLSANIASLTRRDEVGAMARAVQVFKDAAIHNKQLEEEAAAAREAQVAQRDRQSAIDNAKAEDLKVFVRHVEAGFDALSVGDLTVRMNEADAPSATLST